VSLAVERPAYKRLGGPMGLSCVSVLLSNLFKKSAIFARRVRCPRSSPTSSKSCYLYTPRAALLAVTLCIRTAVRLGEMCYWLLRLETAVAEGSAFV
jgi:hypothetical protein